MASRMSLKPFLTTARKALLSPPSSTRPKPLTFVIGNESADLDSLCSAIALAYLRTHSPPNHTLHIPLANLYRPDLALRPEFGAVLRRAGLQLDDVLTLTELEQADFRPEDSRWVLVDHNVLSAQLKDKFGDRVVGCIDHHVDEGTVSALADEPRIIRKSGSCASLVLEYSKETWATIAGMRDGGKKMDGNGQEDWDAQLAFVVLGAILIDTTALTSKFKTTPVDVEAAEFAEALIRRAGLAYDRDGYMKELAELKEDLSGMTLRDVFRKDYKEWRDGGLTLGMSSVVKGVEYLIEKGGNKDALLSELRKWAEERNLDIMCVMTTLHVDGVFAREALAWAFNGHAVSALKRFADANKDKLSLETWKAGKLDYTSGSTEWRACWWTSTHYSRKQVAPLLREAMSASVLAPGPARTGQAGL